MLGPTHHFEDSDGEGRVGMDDMETPGTNALSVERIYGQVVL
jgi:hypothetical protein